MMEQVGLTSLYIHNIIILSILVTATWILTPWYETIMGNAIALSDTSIQEIFYLSLYNNTHIK